MSNSILLIADPNTLRRTAALRRCKQQLGVTVLGAATLGEAYVLIESHLPSRVAVAAEIADMREFETVSDMLSMINSDIIVYGRNRRPDPDAAAHDRMIEQMATALLRGLSPGRTTPRPASAPVMPVPATSLSGPLDPPAGLIVIGASTGGITALETVLACLPADCPPCLVVQHIRPGFAEGLVRRLDQMLAPRVVAAEDGALLRRGTIYLAVETERHLGVICRGGLRLRVHAAPAVSGHRPSVDALFLDAAAIADRLDVRAALLTGMGADGAEGMCALRQAGALTIAQDRDSSVVWGMPRVAIEMGGADVVLPLGRIGPCLISQETARLRKAP
ncbi:CheB methylesterase domain-containing protein [Paracoccus sp. (in: a-proteobacteria)]|uniref:CheB methylesterase domain-containing protein n=1 Tax=Paracoccus sp. TaxID=267 RepID=UPI00396C722D